MESARDGSSDHVRQKGTDKRKKEKKNNNKAGAGEAVLLGALAGGVNVKLPVSISPYAWSHHMLWSSRKLLIFNKASDLLIFWSDLQQSDYCRKSDFWNVPTLHKDFLLQESGLTLRVVVLWSLEWSLREILVEVEVIVRLCLFVVVWKIRVYGFRLHFGTLQIEICAESKPFWGGAEWDCEKSYLAARWIAICVNQNTQI